MASVDWMKCKGGRDAKAKFWHCDEQKRLEHEHSNKQIDKTRTHLNMSFGAFEDGYDAVCKLYDETIAELDAQPGANKRRDRVTCVGWTLPAPEGMSEEQAREWIVDAYETLKARYGDCMLGGTAHFDEVHEYRDAETGEKRQSRPHLHVYAVPIVDGKLNGKSFTARRNMLAMNSAIERMTQEDFPGFKFQNGTKKKSRKSVEELKNQSAVAEVVAEAKAEAAKIVESARNQADLLEAKASENLYESEERLRDAQKRSDELISDAESKAEEIIDRAEKTAQKASEAVQKEREEVQAEREGVERARHALSSVYANMLKETEYYDKAKLAYIVAKNQTGLQSAEEYMKKRGVRLKDGTRETIYDGYAREVLKPQAERIAKRDAEPEKHAENVRQLKRRVVDLHISTDDGKNDRGLGD
uniref:Uncharacterized protein n=1 Tax=uncultured prokaryote TaxID=198431 RepID=A0A0H5Q7Y5_9ZZZZ|nr:hypothetical protein [uncultured prokaryote]